MSEVASVAPTETEMLSDSYLVIVKPYTSGPPDEVYPYQRVVFTRAEWEKTIAVCPGLVAWCTAWDKTTYTNVPGFPGNEVVVYTMELPQGVTGLHLKDVVTAKGCALHPDKPYPRALHKLFLAVGTNWDRVHFREEGDSPQAKRPRLTE